MFRIGEFAALTQVPISQLRYYDEIGLFKPAHISDSGYRYYRADQIPALNRIIVLKELGFSLEQVAGMVGDDIPTSQMTTLLTQRREQIIQTLKDEVARLRQVETRIEQLDRDGQIAPHRVVLKAIPATRYLAVAAPPDALNEPALMQALYAARAHTRLPKRAQLLAVIHDRDTDDIAYELGYTVGESVKRGITLEDGLRLGLQTLPAVEHMATLVYAGGWNDTHAAFAALGGWIDANEYTVAGPFRKVFHQLQSPDIDAMAVVELQIPVTPLTES